MAHWNFHFSPVDGTIIGADRCYDAPHKLIGTPPRRRYSRVGRPSKLFKGHRP